MKTLYLVTGSTNDMPTNKIMELRMFFAKSRLQTGLSTGKKYLEANNN